MTVRETENWFEHFGVMGMHWGKRKADVVPDGETQVQQKKPGVKLQTRGGKGIPASEDAKTAAVSKQKAKSSTTDSLSNQELQNLVTRMNLEQQYEKLTTAQVSPGKKFINKLLTDIVKEQGTKIVKDQTTKLVTEAVKKGTK